MAKLIYGSLVPSTCTQVGNLRITNLGLTEATLAGKVIAIPGDDVLNTTKGRLLLASRQGDYFSSFDSLILCEDFHPLANPNEPLFLAAFNPSGGPPGPEIFCWPILSNRADGGAELCWPVNDIGTRAPFPATGNRHLAAQQGYSFHSPVVPAVEWRLYQGTVNFDFIDGHEVYFYTALIPIGVGTIDIHSDPNFIGLPDAFLIPATGTNATGLLLTESNTVGFAGDPTTNLFRVIDWPFNLYPPPDESSFAPDPAAC